MAERPILIIDAYNAFMRSYAAYPTMSKHGYQMGGTIGFLKIVQRLLLELQPSSVHVVWESGGSMKRRALFKEYKTNRRPGKLNRFYDDDIPDTDENRMHQVTALLGMLKCSPLCQVYVPDCEADDVIAYLCKGMFINEKKIVASSDKDFYQLLDENTCAYSFHKKDYVTPKDVLDTFRVSTKNFALAKALCGDPSDNIPGVQGVGFKTVAKRFPSLGSDEDVLLDDVFNYCHTHLDESIIYRRVLDAEAEVRRNWRLVYLDSSTLSPHQAAKVNSVVSTFEPRANKIGLIKCLIKEGISDFDVDAYLYAFVGISDYKVSG